MPAASRAVQLSIICPAHNERENLQPLAHEIIAAMEPLHIAYEIVIVDDASTDGSANALAAIRSQHPVVRAIRLPTTPTGRGHGQSAAFDAGIRASRGEFIAMMDADLQNDPHDLAAMLALLEEKGAELVQGDRSKSRADSMLKRVSSLVGRVFRRALLDDSIRDTGCSLRVMRREVALALPLQYRGMHRFIPITARRAGFKVVEMPVNHRPRKQGRTKYGILNRAIPGLVDCLAVRWMFKRIARVESSELN